MKETRITQITAETRADPTAAGEALILSGRPIVFDVPTVITDRQGSYTEIIKRGALDGADVSDVRLLFNHDVNRVPLARTPKTMQLKADAAGLSFSATLADTTEARTVYEAVKRGDLSGMSFAFTVEDGGDTWDAATNTRTITKIKRLYECSVVPYPAYPQTSIEARSAQAASLERYKAVQAAKIKINQILTRSV